VTDNTSDTVTDSQLLAITSYWSFWSGKNLDGDVTRRIQLPSKLHDSLALVIQGVRRCGKSTLLRQLIGHYRLNPKHCAFLNFEDPRLGSKLDHRLLDRWLQSFRKKHKRAKRLYFFLDEVQAVSGWESWLRTQLERPNNNYFVITGSNAHLLSGELSGTLTGRHQTLELFPFSLEEYRDLKPRSSLVEYLSDGGFPGPLLIEEGDTVRMQYFLDIVERDIRERIGARSSVPVKQVVQLAYETAGSELSLRRIAGATGIAVDTVSGYLHACESAYLLFACPYFAFSERKRARRNKKYYPVDTGLRRMVITQGGADRGKMLECAVFLELRRHNANISYWRGKGEVDFVIKKKGRIVPIQVSWNAPSQRHHDALEEFYENFPQADEAQFIGPEQYQNGTLAQLVRDMG